jgi:hypothetical protein
MAAIKFTYEGSVAVKGTSFLKASDIDLSTSLDYELEASDASHAKSIQKEFQSLMDKAAKSQVAALNKWLAEKDEGIATMVKRHDELKTMFPLTAQEAKTYAARVKEIQQIAEEVKELPAVFQTMVENWAKGFVDQQSLVAMHTAVKNARIAAFDAKKLRIKAGIAVKVTLVVIGTALAIAAIVLTAGTTAPVFVGLAAAGIALSGISGFGGLAKTIVENASAEKKLLANVTKDVEAVQAAFGNVGKTGSSLTKHVTELQNLIKIRHDQIRALDNDLAKYKAEAHGYMKKLVELNASPMVDKGTLKSQGKSVTEMGAKIDKTLNKISSLKADNQKAVVLLKALTDLGVQLEAISGQAPNSILGNLKERLSSVDGWLELSGDLGGLAGGISGAHR